jgi:hypothetical protein
MADECCIEYLDRGRALVRKLNGPGVRLDVMCKPHRPLRPPEVEL